MGAPWLRMPMPRLLIDAADTLAYGRRATPLLMPCLREFAVAQKAARCDTMLAAADVTALLPWRLALRSAATDCRRCHTPLLLRRAIGATVACFDVE